jgi:dihydroneopterin aldolase
MFGKFTSGLIESLSVDKVTLRNMVFYGYHGVAEQEKILGGKFEVDLELEFDMTMPMRTDHLKDTINYEELYHIVAEVVTKSKCFLIEALSGKILQAVFQHFHPESVCIRIRKPNAPIKGVLDTVEVEMHRTRKEMEAVA